MVVVALGANNLLLEEKDEVCSSSQILLLFTKLKIEIKNGFLAETLLSDKLQNCGVLVFDKTKCQF